MKSLSKTSRVSLLLLVLGVFVVSEASGILVYLRDNKDKCFYEDFPEKNVIPSITLPFLFGLDCFWTSGCVSRVAFDNLGKYEQTNRQSLFPTQSTMKRAKSLWSLSPNQSKWLDTTKTPRRYSRKRAHPKPQCRLPRNQVANLLPQHFHLFPLHSDCFSLMHFKFRSISWVLKAGGKHKFCFKAVKDTAEKRYFNYKLEYKFAHSARPDPSDQQNTLSSQDLSSFNQTVQETIKLLGEAQTRADAFYSTQTMIRKFEDTLFTVNLTKRTPTHLFGRDKQENEKLNKKVTYITLFQISIIILSSVGQIIALRSYFKKKGVIH